MIEIKTDDGEVIKTLARIERKGGNMAGALKIVGERMVRHTDDRFVRQRDPAGKRWAPLRPATRARKHNPRILEERGHLRGSIRYQVDGNTLRVGTNVVYGPIHQLGGSINHRAHSEIFVRNRVAKGAHKGRFAKGTSAGRGFTFKEHKTTIPAREYLGIGADDKKDILEVLGDYLEVK